MLVTRFTAVEMIGAVSTAARIARIDMLGTGQVTTGVTSRYVVSAVVFLAVAAGLRMVSTEVIITLSAGPGVVGADA